MKYNWKCDCCNKSLKSDDIFRKYAITLDYIEVPYIGGSSCMDVHVPSPLDKDYIFCNMKCLKEWLRNG